MCSARLRHQLDKVWVRLQVSRSLGSYIKSLRTCVLDLRYVLDKDVSLTDIASTIIHEATHSRLYRFGYAEAARGRIEAVCRGEERAFLERVPPSESQNLQEKLMRFDQVSDGYWSNANLREDYERGIPEALQYIGLPRWLVAPTLLGRRVVGLLYRLVRIVRRFASGLTRA